MMVVSLTAKGRQLLHEILPEHFQRMAILMHTLSEPERKTLVRLLHKIKEQAAKLAPPAAAHLASTG